MPSSLKKPDRFNSLPGKISLLVALLFALGVIGISTGAAQISLPKGSSPKALEFNHFPSRLHAFVWRNWELVPVETMAQVTKATPSQINSLAATMGLKQQKEISAEFRERTYITVIRRNWHLLPYEQLLELLGWSDEKLAFTLREDDFLYIKLGNLKPSCEPVLYKDPTEDESKRAAEMAQTLKEHFGDQLHSKSGEPLFQFIKDLSTPVEKIDSPVATTNKQSVFAPRYCYSYFALYGDPLLTPELDPYPEAYLQRLAATGVDGVWLQGILEKLSPAPWEAGDGQHEKRLKSLGQLVAKARKHGIGVYIYLNEPRSKPLSFFTKNEPLRGVVEGDHAAVCSSAPEVQKYLREAVANICKAVPDLAGFFTISGSENLSNCWSHHNGGGCPRCSKRPPADVIAEVNNIMASGIAEAGSKARFIAWDWGWADAWAEGIISKLRPEISHMSVSEWSLPIERGGIKTSIGEYSLSAIGPGPRATRHWGFAKKHNLNTLAKVQMGNTWELSAVPYNPALLNVAEHAANLRNANVSGLMLGWTLGGYPSPNLEVVAAISEDKNLAPEAALQKVAQRRFGAKAAPAVVEAWKKFSLSFREFPFDGNLVYNAPMQFGPANLLWEKPTGYAATMIGFPYDDLDRWRGVYPPQIFVQQCEKVAAGYKAGMEELSRTHTELRSSLSARESKALLSEHVVASAAYIHFASTASQGRFVIARGAGDKKAMMEELKQELELAKRLYHLQRGDSRLGYEATNHYYFVGNDLLEKILNCEDLLKRLAAASDK